MKTKRFSKKKVVEIKWSKVLLLYFIQSAEKNQSDQTQGLKSEDESSAKDLDWVSNSDKVF